MLIIFLLSTHGWTHGQNYTIRARIIDSGSGSPVPFSTIIFSETEGTISDNTGYFQFQLNPNAGYDSIKVSCIGFDSRYFKIHEIDPSKLDTLMLDPAMATLDEIQIIGKKKRERTSERIVLDAILAIPDNYNLDKHFTTGYYREYLKHDEEYINLLESIIQFEDQGFRERDDYSVVLNYKRLNRDFKIDSSLLELYNQFTKFVPYGMIPDVSQNNIHILRFANPIRNYKRKSISHFGFFETDFVQNHTFSPREFIHMDGEPYFKIEFTDNQYFRFENVTVRMSGVLYINAKDDAIKKLSYKAVLDKGLIKQQLYEVNLEYIKQGDTYNLHYISHNNLFKHRNFSLENTELKRGRLLLEYSKKPDPKIALDPGNYKITTQGYEQEIETFRQYGDTLIITFDPQSLIARNVPEDYPPWRIIKRKSVKRMYKEILSNLSIEFNNYKDVYGSLLSGEEFSEYYQYREFFAKKTEKEAPNLDAGNMDLAVPIIFNEVTQGLNPDTSWMNTPLIVENIVENKVFSPVPRQNFHIRYNYSKLMNGVNDISYLHTDRELYAPEDTIWYKGYIRNSLRLTPSSSSNSYIVNLVNPAGEIINSEKHLIRDGEVYGQFQLDNDLSPGIYTLSGYSSWMTNFEVEKMFQKKIMIRNEKPAGMQILLECDRESYQPGDTVFMRLHVKDEYNREIEDVALNYEILAGGERIDRGRERTSNTIKTPLFYVLPDDLREQPVIKLNGTHRSYDLDTLYSLPVKASVNVMFFPEGGHLVDGMISNIALKAVSNDGNPLQIKGEILNASNRPVTSVETNTHGMGSFAFKPDRTETHRLVIESEGFMNDTFLLPACKEMGWVMQVTKERKNIVAEIQHNFGLERNALITVTVRGQIAYFDVAAVLNRKRVQIPLDDIPPGVAVITLFDEIMLPQAERLVFVPPSQHIVPKIQTLHSTYLPRDSVQLRIKLQSESPLHKGSYSLSIIDDFMGSSRNLDEHNIVSYLLLSPEIKGEIYQPGSYADPGNQMTLGRTDLLLLTQGWREYTMDYEALPSVVNRDAVYGRLMEPKIGKDPEPVEGSVDVFFSGVSSTIPTDQNGFFTFYPVYTAQNNTDLFLNAKIGRNNRKVSIVLDSSRFEKDLENYLKLLASAEERKTVTKPETYYSFSDHFSYGIENHKWLEEVEIRKTLTPKDSKITDFATDKKTATQEEIDMAVDLEHLIDMVQVPNQFRDTVWYNIDGWIQTTIQEIYSGDGTAPIYFEIPDLSQVNAITPDNIKSLTIVRGPEAEALYGFGRKFVVDIETKISDPRDNNSRFINPLTIEKYSVSKHFYSPRYNSEFKRNNPFPDLRKTIYWNPALPIDEYGYAKITYYNGDRYTRIRCVLEGMTSNGIPIYSEYTYNIGTMRE
ncbi:carboxypeptidase-like regulatory domain-containing protein [Bacteroidota bacterium]